MKDSKIEWVGEIPAEWACIRGKFLLQYKQKPVKKDDEIITCFRNGEVTLRSNRREDGFTMADKEIGYQGVDIGDLVVHGMDGFAGAIGISDSRGKASPVLNVLGTKQNKRYIMYYLRSMAYSDVFMALSTGIRVRSCDLRWNKLAELWYLVPPIEEQKRIAEFLDKKCGEVDALIADIQQEIETLEQYKRSVITEAVTKGLDPSVPMKDSGIDYLGKINGEWRLTKLGYICQKLNRPVLKNAEALICSNKGKVVLRGDISVGLISENDRMYQGVKAGDLCIHGMDTWHGAIAVSSLNGKITTVVHCCDSREDKRFIAYYLQMLSFKKVYKAISNGVRGNTSDFRSWDKAGDIYIVLPNRENQQKIAEFLDKKCKEIEEIIADKQSQIETLESYKKSLIYEYVTGKKEVIA